MANNHHRGIHAFYLSKVPGKLHERYGRLSPTRVKRCIKAEFFSVHGKKGDFVAVGQIFFKLDLQVEELFSSGRLLFANAKDSVV